MWRVMAAGSDTATCLELILPLGAGFPTEARKSRWSAKWFGADTRVSGSLEIVLRYQLKRALPSSPREFLGCGVWFMSTLATGPTMRTERPRSGGGGVWVPGVTAMEHPPSRCGLSAAMLSHVGGERYFGAALILLLSAPRDGDGTDDTTALHDGQRSRSRHNSAIARHNQALKPGLPGDVGQFLGGLLEAGRRIGLVQGDLDRDRTSTVHTTERDHPTALVDHHGGHRDVKLRGLGMRAPHHLDRLLPRDGHGPRLSGFGIWDAITA